jgi:hypothetical protein
MISTYKLFFMGVNIVRPENALVWNARFVKLFTRIGKRKF